MGLPWGSIELLHPDAPTALALDQSNSIGLHEEQVSVGRSSKCDVRLSKDLFWVSNMHFKLTLDPKNRPCVFDNSLNGTWVNGDALIRGEERLLVDGDQIQLISSLDEPRPVELIFVFRASSRCNTEMDVASGCSSLAQTSKVSKARRRTDRSHPSPADGGGRFAPAVSEELVSSVLLSMDLLAHIFEILGMHGTMLVAGVCRRWNSCAKAKVAGWALLHAKVSVTRKLLESPSFCVGLPDDADAAAPIGRICVTDCSRKPVRVLSPWREVRTHGVKGHGRDEFWYASGVAVGHDSLYVADCANNRVHRLRLSDGSIIAQVGSIGNLRQPEGCALHRDTLFVADFGNSRLVALDAFTLETKFTVGHRGHGFGQLNGPRGIAVHGDEVIVSEAQNHRLHVFTIKENSCVFARTLGCRGDGPGQFRNPYGIVVHEGHILVAEFDNKRLQVLTLEGAPRQVVWLPEGTKPRGVCIAAGNAYVVDWWGDRLHEIPLYSAEDQKQAQLRFIRGSVEPKVGARTKRGRAQEDMPKRRSPRLQASS